MKGYVLHLFCDGVLSETRLFGQQTKARAALAKALEEIGVGVFDGEVVDANGCTWSGSVEGVELE